MGTRHQPHSARSCVLSGRLEGARGGRLLPGCGASGVGRSPTANRLPSGRAAGAHYPLAVGAEGCGRGDPSPTPQRALFRAGFARCGGGTGAPGGGASCLGVGRPGSVALPPPTARPLGGLPGPTTHWLWVRGGAAWGPVTNLAARALACCGGGLRVPGGGASCLGVGRLGSGALPLPTARPLGGLPGPTTHWLWVRGGAGVGTRHQPHSARSCELALRAVGAARGRPGGAAPACVWGVRGRTLSRPRLPALWAGCWGPLPTGCGYGGLRACGPVPDPTARALASWLCALLGRHEGARGGRLLPGCGASGVGRSLTPGCPPSGGAAGAYYPLAVGAGGCGRGDPSPTPQRALLRAGVARCGGGTGAPGGGASCLVVGRPGSGALPSPTARPLSGLPGPTTHRLWVRGDAGMGTRHQPHSARSCVLWGRLEGARGGRLLPACGATGLGRSPTPDCPPSGWAAGGPLPTGCGCGGLRAWGPVTNPTARALACCRGGLRVPGGGASCLCVGRPGLGALPPPTARPLGGLPGPTTHWLWVRGVRAWGPVTNPTARALACCGGGLRVPWGGASCLGVGRPGLGALPPPTARPLGGLPGPTTHWLWVRRGAGVGTRHQPHSARSCELALRAVGVARGRPGGAAPACVWGVRGRSLSRPRLPALWAGCWGPLPTGCGYGGLRAWGPIPDPTARTLASWLCALWGRHEGSRGGRLLPGCGASGVGRSLTPGCPPSGGAAGAYYPLAVGAGGCGCGDPSPTPQRALLRAGFARCGGGTRAPGGGASCLGVGRPGSGALPSPTARPLGGLPGPTTHWLWVRGGAGVGTRHQPHSARSCVLWGRLEGARGGRLLPACGASGVGRSPTPDCPPSGWAAGVPLASGCGCGGVPAWGPVTNPTARALACCRGGLRVPGGGASCLGLGRPGLGALPPPTACPLGGLPGPTTHWQWVRGGAGEGTRHQPHSARSCVLWGQLEGALGGRLLPGCGASGVGRSPFPDRPPSGRAAGAHYPLAVGAEGCGRGDPSSTPQRALLRAGFARCGGGTGAPGGGASCLGVGRPGSVALPPPTACPLGGLPGPTTYWLWCGGVQAWGPVTNPTARALASWLCALWGRHEGSRGGVPLAWVWGVRGRALSQPRPPALWAGCLGPLPTGCGCGGVRAWGPVTNPTANALASWLCALWARHEGARGGRLLPGCRASGVGRSTTPDCPPSGRAAGAHYPLAVGAGGFGRGDPSPTPQRALLRAVGAA